MSVIANETWAPLPYQDFLSTAYLLRRCLQIAGKLKLNTPFEPHWANVALWITSRGLTTGLIPYANDCFSVEFDMVNHHVNIVKVSGGQERLQLKTMTVADFTESFFAAMRRLGLNVQINMMPQEIPDAIPLNQDNTSCEYNPILANTWWRILVKSYLVLKQYHARFAGITPPIGFMWGTFDLRDARYLNKKIAGSENGGFITRNAYDAPQVEAGWWSGDPTYPKPAYFTLIFPIPDGIEKLRVKPDKARWDKEKKIFVLDYDDICLNKDPNKDLLAFFESTYQTSTELAGWDANLITSGEPV